MAFKVPVRRGEQHPLSKLMDEERFECRRRYLSGESITHLAGEKGTANSTMHRIVHDPAYSEKNQPTKLTNKEVSK
jgi:hypothetical protein